MNIAYCYLKNWFKYALEIIQNDTDIAYELQNFPIENRFFKSSEWEAPCKEVLGAFLTDCLLNFEHYDFNCMGAAETQQLSADKSCDQKTIQNWVLRR